MRGRQENDGMDTRHHFRIMLIILPEYICLEAVSSNSHPRQHSITHLFNYKASHRMGNENDGTLIRASAR